MPAQNTPLLAMEVELRNLSVSDPLGISHNSQKDPAYV
jgi:hypothetical protein